MTFGEKLLQLRKEKGLSQEEVAEQVGTTRQAISKWENDQGYPETEKLLMLSNFFDVSIDYLLKEGSLQQEEKETGHYVSRELAQSFLWNQQKLAARLSLFFSLICLLPIPYFFFKEQPAVYIPLCTGLTVLVAISLVAASSAEDTSFNVLKTVPLFFDAHVQKELNQRYQKQKKNYALLFVLGIVFFCIGFVPMVLLSEFLPSEPPPSDLVVALGFFSISIGAYFLSYALSLLEAYDLLVRNEQHQAKISVKFQRKIKQRFDRLTSAI